LPKVKLKGRVIGKDPSSSPVIVDMLQTNGVLAWVIGDAKNIVPMKNIGINSR
jgi:hypothetical protein